MSRDAILIISVIGLLLFIVAYACKIEYHFQYLKIFFPERLGRYKSRAHAQRKFMFAPDIDFQLFIPFFFEKDLVVKDQDEKIVRLKKRIRNSLLIIWFEIAFLTVVLILRFNNVI
jgi:hypothetical protein